MSRAGLALPSGILLAIKVLLIAVGICLTNHEFLPRLAYFYNFKLVLPFTVFVGIWVASVAAISYIAFTRRTVERVIWSILICFAVLLGETYYQVTEHHLTIGALDAMWDPSLFTMEIAAFYGKHFLEALGRTAPLFIGLMIPFEEPGFLKWRGLIAVPLVPVLLCSGLVFYVGVSEGNELKAMPSQFLIPGIFGVYTVSIPPRPERLEVDIPIKAPTRLQNIILVVDESISGDFIDLNVLRGTTPFLLSQSASIANFGLATSSNNCSNASNAILRMGVNPDWLGTSDNNILSNPSIWKYARKAGFETNFVESQRISSRHQNFMNEAELELIDHIATSTIGFEYSQRDISLPGKISEILSRPQPQFIYINKFGAHFPYLRTYPDNETVYRPTMQAYETIENRERLVNTYKNSIRWSVDHFFELLFEEIDLSDTVLIYTSDHGQNLLDDGRPVTHCRRSQESIHEAVVPLLVWSGDELIRQRFLEAAELNYGNASHFEIFPTVLQLFGYDSELVKQRYHQSLFEKIDSPKGFTSGPVMGRFGMQANWHSRDGLDRLDR